MHIVHDFVIGEGPGVASASGELLFDSFWGQDCSFTTCFGRLRILWMFSFHFIRRAL